MSLRPDSPGPRAWCGTKSRAYFGPESYRRFSRGDFPMTGQPGSWSSRSIGTRNRIQSFPWQRGEIRSISLQFCWRRCCVAGNQSNRGSGSYILDLTYQLQEPRRGVGEVVEAAVASKLSQRHASHTRATGAKVGSHRGTEPVRSLRPVTLGPSTGHSTPERTQFSRE